ncbi:MULTISPECIES: hypothetical protein [unclassified Streptomyces]|uniref:hypothetical protein n=1 Tax=unclassified Streptomyces TaxID=2593676 RepID=UPI0033D2C37C
MTRNWPSRQEWQARAEYAVHTACTMYERLDRIQPDTTWSSLAEDEEMATLARTAASALRPLLTAEISRLRAVFPERPAQSRARAAWFVALEADRYEQACNLGALEDMRRQVQRAVKDDSWWTVAGQLGRIRKHYTAIHLPPEVLAAETRMTAIGAAVDERRKTAAIALEREAVDREIARRATDQAWEQELERRRRIDEPRVIRIPAGRNVES